MPVFFMLEAWLAGLASVNLLSNGILLTQPFAFY